MYGACEGRVGDECAADLLRLTRDVLLSPYEDPIDNLEHEIHGEDDDGDDSVEDGAGEANKSIAILIGALTQNGATRLQSAGEARGGEGRRKQETAGR